MVCATTSLAYPKQPCVCLKVNIQSDVIFSESSTLFYVTHNCDLCHVTGE